jgi:predicted lipase
MKLTNFFLFFCPLFNLVNSILDLNHLYNGVWLSGAAYCDKEYYKNMSIGGTALGFSYKNTIYDIKTDIQGYIGTLSTTKSIYVVLRGSSSKLNWLDDFEVSLVPYITYPQCNCTVHKGFYDSVLSIRNKTIDIVNFLKKIYLNYSVVIIGHSYGASCGQLLAMELEKEGIETIIYNYGQPRVGDSKYASYVNNIIKEYWRVTHNKDIVPHVPPIEFNYKHSCKELFEDENGKLNECSSINCEDMKCANQYNIYQTNTNDHLYYLQHRLSCNESTI